MYGHFICTDRECRGYWESAHTYRKPKGEMRRNRKGKLIPAFWKQKCKGCGTFCYPCWWEHTVCRECGEISRYCECYEKHNDPKKPHLSDLCERCIAGIPCQRYRDRNENKWHLLV